MGRPADDRTAVHGDRRRHESDPGTAEYCVKGDNLKVMTSEGTLIIAKRQ